MDGKTKLTCYAVVVALLMICVLFGGAPVLAAVTERISTPTLGDLGSGRSMQVSISADGRYVAFTSSASNLVAGDTNGLGDVFVRDRLSGSVERISVSSMGEQAQGGSSEAPVITPDGRYVAFFSRATNLVAGPVNSTSDVFVRDRLTGVTEIASISSSGARGNDDSAHPTISSDGRYVAFESLSTNLAAGIDTNFTYDVFLRDMVSGITSRISNAPSGNAANHGGVWPHISGDASCVVFESYSSDLVPGDTNDRLDIFVYGMSTGTIERVSVSSAGDQANEESQSVSVSANGRFVAFASEASNLVGGDTNADWDIFVRDRITGVTELVSVSSVGERGNLGSGGAAISADGRFVAFHSLASNLVGGDTNSEVDVFVRDRLTGVTELVSVSSSGQRGNDGSVDPAVSADGRCVAYESLASNLVSGDTNGDWDTFLLDRFGYSYSHPENVSLSSTTETLGTTPFTLTSLCRDANGFADISRCYLLLNDSNGQTNAAFLCYDRAANRIYLKNDAGTSWGTGYTPGTKVTLQNSQCYVYVGSTSVTGSGNDRTINWGMALKSAFATKSLNAYMFVNDAEGLADGWERMAVFYNIAPEALSITPSTGPIPMDTWTSLTSYFRDQNGYQDLRKCYLLVNNSLTQNNAMFLCYDRKSNRVYLKNDGNTAWSTGYAPGTDVVLDNSQCSVRVKSIAVSHSGNNMAISWSFQLKSKTMGKKSLYSWLYATDSKDANSGYERVGTHFSPVAPESVSLSPSSGTVSTGVTTSFLATYTDNNGFADIYKTYIQVSATSSQANAVLLMYDARQNKVFLRNDANTSWGSGGVPGTAVTLENSQCRVNLASMAMPWSLPDFQLQVSWPIQLKPTSATSLCLRLYVQDNAFLDGGWRVMGYIRPL